MLSRGWQGVVPFQEQPDGQGRSWPPGYREARALVSGAFDFCAVP